ncbi:MAG: hypothetical protein HY519_03570 [Candidatus Aenigmarchaeota archaeon]|nr:hypothetical protein [Candidatus Aenigmarchaeota archaeon]
MNYKSFLHIPEKLAKPVGYIAGAGVIAGDGHYPDAMVADGFQALGEVGQAGVDAAGIVYDSIAGTSMANGLGKYAPVVSDWMSQASDHTANLVSNLSQISTQFDDFSERAVISAAAIGIGYLLHEGVKFYRTEGRGGLLTRFARRRGEKIWPTSRYDTKKNGSTEKFK